MSTSTPSVGPKVVRPHFAQLHGRRNVHHRYLTPLLGHLSSNNTLCIVHGEKIVDRARRVSSVCFLVNGIPSDVNTPMNHNTSAYRITCGNCWSTRMVHTVLGALKASKQTKV